MTKSGGERRARRLRRLEHPAGPAKRQDWPFNAKAAIVVESCSAVDTVSVVARRYGLSPAQMFTWRRELRELLKDPKMVLAQANALSFVSVVSMSAPSNGSASGGKLVMVAIDREGCPRGADQTPEDAAPVGSSTIARLMVATRPVDLRKRPAALAALIENQRSGDEHVDAIYVFRAKHLDQIKLLWWDGAVWHAEAKTVEQADFDWPGGQDSVIRRWHFREEVQIWEIERRTGLSRNTIRKYLRASAVEPKFRARDRPSKLDPFAEKLSGWLRGEAAKSHKQRRTAKQMHADLVALGYEGSYNRVAALVRAWKDAVRDKLLRASQPRKAFQGPYTAPRRNIVPDGSIFIWLSH